MNTSEIPQDRLIVLSKCHDLNLKLDAETPHTQKNTPLAENEPGLHASSFITTIHSQPDDFLTKPQKILLKALNDEWGDQLCEDIVAIEYVSWHNAWICDDSSDDGMEKVRTETTDSAYHPITLRHAVVLTLDSLFLIEVHLQTGEDEIADFHPADNGCDSKTHSRSNSASEWAMSRKTVRCLKIACELKPQHIDEVSLPYKSIVLPNGEEMARKSSDMVLITTTENYFWLEFDSNETRGMMVDYLQEWYQMVPQEGQDLAVSQVQDDEILSHIELDDFRQFSSHRIDIRQPEKQKKILHFNLCVLS